MGKGECVLRAACSCGRFQPYPKKPQNAMTIMYSKEDILFKALKVQTSRESNYCQKVRPIVLEKIRRMPNNTIPWKAETESGMEAGMEVIIIMTVADIMP